MSTNYPPKRDKRSSEQPDGAIISANKRSSEQPVVQNPQDVLMSAPVGFFTTTPDGRYLSANNTLTQMHGYDFPRHFAILNVLPG